MGAIGLYLYWIPIGRLTKENGPTAHFFTTLGRRYFPKDMAPNFSISVFGKTSRFLVKSITFLAIGPGRVAMRAWTGEQEQRSLNELLFGVYRGTGKSSTNRAISRVAMVRDKQSISVSNNLNNILTILIYNFYTFGYTWGFACHVCLPLDLPEHLLSLPYSSLFQEYCLRCKGTDLHVTTTIAEKHQDSETLREQHWHLVPNFIIVYVENSQDTCQVQNSTNFCLAEGFSLVSSPFCAGSAADEQRFPRTLSGHDSVEHRRHVHWRRDHGKPEHRTNKWHKWCLKMWHFPWT